MMLMKRWRQWRAFRQMARLWRESTGGGARYRFHAGGSSYAFSSMECETLEDFAKVIRDFSNLLDAMEAGDLEEVADI